MEGIISSMNTAFTGVSDNVMTMLSKAAPAALAVVGTVMAVKIGIKAFKGMAGQ